MNEEIVTMKITKTLLAMNIINVTHNMHNLCIRLSNNIGMYYSLSQ